jgi:hypothetical protein
MKTEELPPQETTETARIRARMPMFLYRRTLFQHPEKPEEIFYLEWLWMPRGRWRKSEHSTPGRWRALAIGPFVLAYRLAFARA